MRRFVPWLLVVFLAPMAVQADPETHVLHDADRASGYVQAGSPLHYGAAFLEDGEPQRKPMTSFEMQVGDRILYRVASPTGYSYDGFSPVLLTLPPGPFVATAGVSFGTSAEITSEFVGQSLPLTDPIPARLDVQAQVAAGRLRATIAVLDGTRIVEHSDALVEIRRSDGWLIFRTRLHTHTEPMSFEYAFPETGTYEMRVVGYNAFPTNGSRSFEPMVDTRELVVDEVEGFVVPTLVPPPEPSFQDSGDLSLRLTHDPQRNTSTFSRFELGGYVYEASTESLKQHIDFESRIVGAGGRVLFASKSLHEYDGYYDVVFHWPHAGYYTFELTAKRGTWSASAHQPVRVLSVLPGERNNQAASGGPIVLTADGLEGLMAGKEVEIAFYARTAAGTPAQHAEVDFQFRRPNGVPFVQTKLHTHDTGDFSFRVMFPEPGTYQLVLDPVHLHGEPVPSYHFGSLDGGLATTVVVGGEAWSALPPTSVPLLGSTPAPGALAFAVTVGLVAFALRRR